MRRLLVALGIVAALAGPGCGCGKLDPALGNAWTGSTNIVTVGTVTSGTWQGTKVDVPYGGTNCSSASGTCLDNITGFASNGILQRTGAGTYSILSATNTAFDTIAPASPVTGDLLYWNGSHWARLAAAASGVLTSNGAGAAPSYQAGVGGYSQLHWGATSTTSGQYVFPNNPANTGTNPSGAVKTRILMSRAGTFYSTQGLLTTAPGGVATTTFTVRKSGSDTAHTCVVTGVATTCSGSTSFTFIAGDTLELRDDETGTAPGALIVTGAVQFN